MGPLTVEKAVEMVRGSSAWLRSHRGELGIAALLWSGMLGVAILPLPLSFGVLGLVVYSAAWLAVGCALYLLADGRRFKVFGVLGTCVLAFVLVNWSMLAPRTWFELHRPFFEIAVRDVQATECGTADRLPVPLMWLSADGTVSGKCVWVNGADERSGYGAAFFPQWFGIPDDAGGYIYSPEGPPSGMDMSGMWCSTPVDLGGDWWMCGM